ncbi:MAG: bifunctional DNA-formamidopyrimidine glycosylase/DNA-(apurinic or apyrimidinic site) lyase [Patescibacteria group bacterium]|uniref:Bifunctional DNA-formamidopyrimidine glycosylase/DNA-(Apurinic or apyrimidinic site) lyase n=1 Tax=candidate division WWE3 bacterium TaxID=2053526 RepID=A0A955EAY6_UNCKA|nr:bifunctional DNA-formamidopyrimidine glycosylase/DNA-(apurinic or apyrimidinic site) lyase [candidate division WWE3 bacterium]
MPELPEVHTITTDLNKHLVGWDIAHVRLIDNYRVNLPADTFIESLEKKQIQNVERIGKNIVIRLPDELSLTIHLAMTGQTLIRSATFQRDKYERVIFTLINPQTHKQLELRFCDKRMFGKVQIIDKQGYNELKAKHGPEPINENLTPEKFLERLRLNKTVIKKQLLNQEAVAGLGNAYATDALWMAKIHPETLTTSLNVNMATVLLKACKEILLEGINNRGISMSDYVDAFGKKGSQQEHFRIYRQEKCRRCDMPVTIKEIAGRNTYYCEKCQEKDNQARLL